jgi:hypothetical protein
MRRISRRGEAAAPYPFSNRHPADNSARRGRRALPLDSMRYVLILLPTLGACFGIQALALRAVGGKTAKSESNFFSSVARIQSGARGEPEVMFLGSSITGRLPDRTNGFKGVANMGCDGGSAADALRAMDRGLLPAAPLLIIEGNTIFLGIGGKETEIAQAMKSPWFAFGRRFEPFSATARPAAFAYSKLLARKIGAAGSPDGVPEPPVIRPYVPAKNAVQTANEGEQALVEELAAIIGRLETRGSKCWMLILPPRIEPGGNQHNLVVAIAARARIPFWDLGSGIPQQRIALTDGVHMAPESAALTVREVLRELKVRSQSTSPF